LLFGNLFAGVRKGDASSDDSTIAKPVAARPSIGLALGGGGARGFAHIGIIRTLAQQGIIPDVIVGTSIGAIVGGCYAANQLDTLEAWTRDLTLRGIIHYLDISLSGSGLIRGDHLSKQLDAGLGDSRIDDLPIRFAAIATELHTGHEIWLTRGRLANAIRASYALPGLFPPVRIGGRWLVDGALVNPVPVSAARALGARLVIAVNIGSNLAAHGSVIASHGPEDADLVKSSEGNGLLGIFRRDRTPRKRPIRQRGHPGIHNVMVESYNVMQDRITRARLAGDPPDVLINPQFGTVGWFDFHRANETIAIGSQAAERTIDAVAETIRALF
jgi:NTE family protein